MFSPKVPLKNQITVQEINAPQNHSLNHVKDIIVRNRDFAYLFGCVKTLISDFKPSLKKGMIPLAFDHKNQPIQLLIKIIWQNYPLLCATIIARLSFLFSTARLRWLELKQVLSCKD